MTDEIKHPKKYPERPIERQRARGLRRAQTDAERELWMRVRWRQLSGYKFRRQYPIPPFYADFCCLEARLVVELDGGQHLADPGANQKRTVLLNRLGFRVIRFSDSDVLARPDAVLEAILSELQRTDYRQL